MNGYVAKPDNIHPWDFGMAFAKLIRQARSSLSYNYQLL